MRKLDVPVEWMNAPRQERSQKTLERLLDAAETLIREGGLEAVTIPAVVERAGSSVGSFYARFADKDALLETLHVRACAQTVATADRLLDPKLWEGRTLEDVIEGTISVAVRLFGSRRSVIAAFQRALGAQPGYAMRRARNGVELGERALRLFLVHRERIGHPAPEVAIPMVLRVVTATLEQRNAFASAGVREVDVDDDALAEELRRMVVAYLAIKPEAAHSAPPRGPSPRRRGTRSPART